MKRFILSLLLVLCAVATAEAQWGGGYAYQGYYQPYGGYYGYQSYPVQSYGYGRGGQYGYYYQFGPQGTSWWGGVGGGGISVYNPVSRGYHGKGW